MTYNLANLHTCLPAVAKLQPTSRKPRPALLQHLGMLFRVFRQNFILLRPLGMFFRVFRRNFILLKVNNSRAHLPSTRGNSKATLLLLLSTRRIVIKPNFRGNPDSWWMHVTIPLSLKFVFPTREPPRRPN